MTDPTSLSATDAVRLIRARQLSAGELVAACLDRIDRLEPSLRAWVMVDREGARRAAQAVDAGRVQGALIGLPFGVKDIVDVAGMPTAAGFAPFADRTAAADATAVARQRGAGAIPVGKTATTQFAYRDPPATRNPWSAAATPGGSSTGSAVAVAARMVPLAIGTQSGGSVLRPSAYNGVVGYKPTFGLVSKAGVLPLSAVCDHVGVSVRTVADAQLWRRTVAGLDPLDPTSGEGASGRRPAAGRRIGILTPALGLVSAEVRERVLDAARRFEAAGAEVVEVESPVPLDLVFAAHRTILQVDTAAVHATLFAERGGDYGPLLRASISVGRVIPGAVYARAQAIRYATRRAFDGLLGALDALLLPTCDIAPAPPATGDASLQAIFSCTGQPAVSLPHGLSASGLPLAVQLAGARFDDDRFLRLAAWCERRLDKVGPPPGIAA